MKQRNFLTFLICFVAGIFKYFVYFSIFKYGSEEVNVIFGCLRGNIGYYCLSADWEYGKYYGKNILLITPDWEFKQSPEKDIFNPDFECQSSPVKENILHQIITFNRATSMIYSSIILFMALSRCKQRWGGFYWPSFTLDSYLKRAQLGVGGIGHILIILWWLQTQSDWRTQVRMGTEAKAK